MKKLIAIASAAFSVAFALALANAGDTGTQAGGTSSDPAMSQEQPGATGSDMSADTTSPDRSANPDMSKGYDTSKGSDMSKSQTQAAREKRWKNAKSCTDKDGITYRRGQPGFDSCIQSKMEQMGGSVSKEEMEKSKSNEESMGGTSGSSSGKTGSSTDYGTSDETNR